MVTVYFSHTGNPILKNRKQIECSSGSVKDIINELDKMAEFHGIKNSILTCDDKIMPSARIFMDIGVETSINKISAFSFYENSDTVEIKNVKESYVDNDHNLLISLFEPQYLKMLFEEAIAPRQQEFIFKDVNDKVKNRLYKPFISDEEIKVIEEPIYKFKEGETTLADLEIDDEQDFKLTIDNNGFNKAHSRLLPTQMVNAICEIWGLPNKNSKLRLFQEDALFFIIAKLLKAYYPKENCLLISMPTGGGKTEAFMIPLLAYIFKKKQKESMGHAPGNTIKAIIIYPTNALANDQAKRFVELIYLLNKTLINLPQRRKVTIGILTGDTPSHSGGLPKDSLIQICPKCGNSQFKREERLDEDTGQQRVVLRCNGTYKDHICGHVLDYCRLTKDDILNSPPDILITNPDEINYALHSPKYAPIFYNKVDAMVFDEVHMYEGVFGCHISHLLRRLEEITEYKPLYIGLSATIGNAKELAALLFNEKIDRIRYINNQDNRYTTDLIDRRRYHMLLKPVKFEKQNDDDDDRYERTLTTAYVIGQIIGHLIADPHFRKTIIFANYRSDADDIAKYFKEREEIDYYLYISSIINKLNNGVPLDDEETTIVTYLNQWFTIISKNAVPNTALVEVGWNRGGLEKEARIRAVHSFTSNQLIKEDEEDDRGQILSITEKPIDIMVATKTLELGIDIGDVSTIINSSATYTANEYVQRVGRGGRRKDSAAITIINPENASDAYFEKHFEEYVKAERFEDAPIIITNEIIVKRHILARILDYAAKCLYMNGWRANYGDITVSDFIKVFTFIDENGTSIKFDKNCSADIAKKIARLFFDKVFNKLINGYKVIDLYLEYLHNEAEVIGTSPTDITADKVLEIIEQKMLDIQSKLKEGQNVWKDHDFLSGYGNIDKELNPSLRGSGAVVDLYISDNDAIPKDVVARSQAYSLMPITAPATSGISTFKVYGVKGIGDTQTIAAIKRTIRNNPKALAYYGTKFTGFPTDIGDFVDYFTPVVPEDLRVDYFPKRFYCKKCMKGLTYSEIRETQHGILCAYCNGKVMQLSQVYLCAAKDGCGYLIEPPVPKACINPECPDFIAFYNDMKKNRFRYKPEMSKRFRFRLTRDMEWVCQSCKAKISFCASYRIENSNPYSEELKKVAKEWPSRVSKETPLGLAVYMKVHPEYYFNNKNNSSAFNCPNCHKATVDTVPIPRVRTISYNFISKGNKRIKPPKDIVIDKGAFRQRIGQMEFTDGAIVQLSNQYVRRYFAGVGRNKEHVLKFCDIFPGEGPNVYWSNYFQTHLAWLKFDPIVDNFIKTGMKCDRNCNECQKINDLELGSLIKPKRKIEDYNWDDIEQKPKKPDPREKFCDRAVRGECLNQTCEGCSYFVHVEDSYYRFILMHTLKHCLLWAMPKYAGVNISSIRAEIYPNDDMEACDMVFIDSDEGGSGAIILVEKNWDDIWAFSREIINMAVHDKANILLPHTCTRFNKDLCPYIASDFMNFLGL